MKERKIAFEIKKLDNMIERKIFKGIDKLKLTNTQVRILKYLCDNKDKVIYQSSIEKEVSVRRSTISGILNTMEKNNLIKRVACKNDSRKKQVALTDYSLNKHKEIAQKIANFEDDLLRGITKEETDYLFKIIDKLEENLK